MNHDIGPIDAGDVSAWRSVPTLDVEGEPIEFYPAGFEMPGVRIADLDGYDFRHDVAFDRHPHVRRAVVRYRIGEQLVRRFGALRFPDAVDLHALDRRIVAGDLDPAPFDTAVFGVAREVLCRACRQSSLLLIVEPALPCTSARRVRAHHVEVHCPQCGADRFHPYLEVLTG